MVMRRALQALGESDLGLNVHRSATMVVTAMSMRSPGYRRYLGCIQTVATGETPPTPKRAYFGAWVVTHCEHED